MTHPTSLTALRPMQAENQDAREQAEESAAREAVALEDLVAEHQQRIAGLAYRLLDRPDDVADVVQEVFLAAFRNLRRFRGESSLATWLTTITVNKCRSHVRRRRLGLRAWLEIAARAVASGGGPGPGEGRGTRGGPPGGGPIAPPLSRADRAAILPEDADCGDRRSAANIALQRRSAAEPRPGQASRNIVRPSE